MRVKNAVSAGLLALATAIAAPALAQDNAAANNPDQSTQTNNDQNVTQDIVVTAQFRSTKLQDTPLAITAMNAKLLDERGQTNVAEIASQAPNVTLKSQPQANGIGLIASIRGVGQTDFNYALEPGVGIYVDDIYIPTLSSSLLDLMDLDRIEVLRGPQGVLGGKNSIGGAIKLFSIKPQGDGTGSLQVTYGSLNRIDARGYADVAITDNLFARFSGATKNRDGYVTLLDYGVTHPGGNVQANNNAGKNGVLGTLGSQHYTAGKLALRWMPTDKLEVNFSADYTTEHEDSTAEVVLAAGKPQAHFNPATPNPATSVAGNPWLVGKNGSAVPVDCHFVPNGQYGCDTTPAGYDSRFISYANFLDASPATAQAPYKPYAAIPGNGFDGWGLMGNVKLDLNDNLNALWISSYRHYGSTWGEDQDGTPVPVAQLNQTLDHYAWSQELRLNGKVNTLADYTLGGFYFKQDGSLKARVDLNYAGIDFLHGPDTTPSTSKALFFNGTLHLTPQFNLSGGIRHTWDKKTYTYLRRNPDLTIPGPCQFFTVPGNTLHGPTDLGNDPNCLLVGLYNVSGTFQGERTDWRLSADYRWSDALMTYASISTGYKGGGVNPRPFFGPATGECSALPAGSTAPCNQIQSFKPETITTYETGFKSDFFDRRVRLNGAFFYNKYNDIILTLSACPGSPCLLPANVGKANVWGLELESTIKPIDGLTIDGSWSYIHFKYTTTGTSGVSLAAITPYTPQWNWSMGVQYDITTAKGSTVSARVDNSYQSHFFTEASNSPFSRVQSHMLTNASLRYQTPDKKWEASLEVQNLLNKYYMISVSDVSSSLGVVTGQPAMPRTWAITIKRNF